MRTTIEISKGIREKLVSEAARRDLKGYSKIIEEALEFYFSARRNQTSKTREERINLLLGSMDLSELKSDEKRRRSLRKNWKKK